MGIRKFVIEFVFWREPPLEVGYTFVTLIFTAIYSINFVWIISGKFITDFIIL